MFYPTSTMEFTLTLGLPDVLLIIVAQALTVSVGFLLLYWKKDYLIGYVVGYSLQRYQGELVAIGQKLLQSFIQKNAPKGGQGSGGSMDLGEMLKQMFMQIAMQKGQEWLGKTVGSASGNSIWK